MTDTIQVAVYAEHTARAGQRCWDDDKIERNSDDVVIYTGSQDYLREIAASLRRTDDAPGRANAYGRAVASVLEDAAMRG